MRHRNEEIIKTKRTRKHKRYKIERGEESENVRMMMIMLILVVHTFSVGLRGALDLEQSYTVDIHTVNSTDGEIQKFSGGRMDWEERGDIR